MSNLITINQLNKDSETRSILYNLDFKIEAGSITALLGLSGNGQGVLLRILAGCEPQTSGTITLKDKLYAPENIAAALKQKVIFISEASPLAPDLTINEHLTLGLKSSPKKDAILSSLKQTGLQDLPLNTLCSALNPAQTRLLLLARATLSQAELYLFDQIDAAFCQQDRDRYFSIIRNLKNNGKTIIFTPAINEAFNFVDNYYLLKDGCISKCSGNSQDITQAMCQDDTGSIFPERSLSRSNNIIMESLGLKGQTLRDASINIREKEICGIFGLNGSGAEELIAILSGQFNSSGGVLSINKRNIQIKKASPKTIHRAGISIFNGRRNSSMDYDTRSIKLRTLSGSVLVLIDPAYGLNNKERTNFYRLITELKLQNRAIILFSPALEELKGISDTIAIIHNGELSAARSTDNWTDEEIYKYVTSGKLEAFSIL